MDITLYIHDFHPQIGHARAMLELLNGLSKEQKQQIKSLEVVAFTSTDLEKLFPDFNCPKSFTRIPFPRLKPFLVKIFFYHLLTWFHSLTKSRAKIKIGIGVACLNVDIVNVQFIHEQWRQHFFNNRKLSLHASIYKKILFTYFLISENIIYKKNRFFIVIADFLKNYLHERFGTDLSSMTLIPSGVNTNEFSLNSLSNAELFHQLAQRYPAIKNLNPEEPIALFVGALERKGIDRVLRAMPAGSQLLVIGKSENSDFKMPETNFRIAHVPFTKEVPLFYQISDMFVFPTRYEPFGLVIIEAYAMGLDIVIPKEDVGASEIIPQSEGIHFFHQNENLQIRELHKITYEEKVKRRNERLELIKKYSWDYSAQKFFTVLTDARLKAHYRENPSDQSFPQNHN